MDISKIKVVAFDLDGTLTQHKHPMSKENKNALNELGKRYKLLMVGAGQVQRIFDQMEHYPIDIIGNYGLQYAKYNEATGELDVIRNLKSECNREEIEKKVTMFRKKYGYETYCGENVEYHPSGCITFPILGTKALQEDKLAFDPDRSKRRAFYDEVVKEFSDYCVFVGGSSSFDMAPKPHNKYNALKLYCEENNLIAENVVFVGDDYGIGGNDESVYKSEFNFICVDDYRKFPEYVKPLLEI